MKRFNKLFAMMFSLLLVFSCVSIPVHAVESVDTSEVKGHYTSGESMTLDLDENGHFTLNGASENLETLTGTFTLTKISAFWGTTVKVAFDEASVDTLRGEGVIPWYGDGTATLGWDRNGATGQFTITIDVSKALVTDAQDYTITTTKSETSPTGYETTITVQDKEYENLYAYGDWVAVYMKLLDENDPTSYDTQTYLPDEWQNGMDYCSSSILPLEKNEDGNWSLTLPLASSVMGVICYHDVNKDDLVGLFPQKISFFVPYDDVKQSDSFDWTPAFPVSETGNEAGTLDTSIVYNDLHISVYTPAGYDPTDTETKYPVVYLVPGGGSDYTSWFADGMVNNVFDNLIAEGKVAPTILVSVNREDVNGDKGHYLEDIIAYIEEHYNTYTDAAHRSLVGVSMGSVASTELWLNNPDLFEYYGFLSGANKETFKVQQEGYEFEELSEERIAQLNQATIFIGGGTTDFNMFTGDANSASVTDLDAWLDHYGIAHNQYDSEGYHIVVGDHNWPIWMKLMMTYATDYLWANNEVETIVPEDPTVPEEPTNPGNTTDQGNTTTPEETTNSHDKTSTVPNTGDTFVTPLWITLAAGSVIAFVAIKKRHSQA